MAIERVSVPALKMTDRQNGARGDALAKTGTTAVAGTQN